MKRIGVLGAVVLVIGCLVVPSLARANGWEGWRGSGGWGADSPYNRCYRPAKAETFSGEVSEITAAVPMPGMTDGIALLLTMKAVSIPVQLGPAWYIERLDAPIEVGDRIEVLGAKAFAEGLPAVIAAEVRRGDKVLVLRDATGFPVWAGWRRVR
ncbi:MAG: DNA-binding protein [Zetaproteobacteria bacterium]|nr:MAG: DNA-binding protein [Zetaproteobacteria bacterium]